MNPTSVNITNLANQRVAVVERVRAALDLLDEVQQLAGSAHLGFPQLVLDESYGCRGRPTITGAHARRAEAEAAMVRIIDIRGWDYLLSESGLRTFMDAKARGQWNNQIAEGDVPELTAANIEATFAQLYGARSDMFERGVFEYFRRLSWNYRTNEPFRFGKRIIARYLLSSGSLNHRVTNELDDLIRVFCVLDGKPEPDHRQGAYYFISEAQHARQTEVMNGYFHLRWFKKRQRSSDVRVSRSRCKNEPDSRKTLPERARLRSAVVPITGRILRLTFPFAYDLASGFAGGACSPFSRRPLIMNSPSTVHTGPRFTPGLFFFFPCHAGRAGSHRQCTRAHH